MRIPIPDEERGNYVRFSLSTVLAVICWAAWHDLLVIHIEPRHFTEYHPQIFPINNLALLGMVWGASASAGPALIYGILLFCVTRLGRWPKVSFRRTLTNLVIMLLLVELACWTVATVNHTTFTKPGEMTIYSPNLFPEFTIGLVITQSLNLTAYVAAFNLGVVFVASLLIMRWLKSNARKRAGG